MVEIPEDYYGKEKVFAFIGLGKFSRSEAVSLLRLVVFGNAYENEVPESSEAQGLISVIEEGLKSSSWMKI